MSAVAIDTETELFGPGNQAPPLICLTWTSAVGQERIAHWRDAHDTVRELILGVNFDSPLVGHNIAYDMCVLGRQFPDLMPAIFDAYARDGIADTLIRERLMDIAYDENLAARTRKSYSLKSLAAKYIGLALDKDAWRLGYGELREVPLVLWADGALNYAKTDARVTLQVYEAQAHEVGADTNLLLDAPAQCRADFALRLAANRGLTACPQRVAQFLGGVRAEFESTKAALLESGLLRAVRRNGATSTTCTRNTRLARERLFAALGHKADRTPTGEVKVDDESCEKSGDSSLIAYSRIAKLQSFLSKDGATLERASRESLHTRFNVLVNSGRTSSSSPNIQNPPREAGVRECFIPRPGFVFASADYNAAELHTLAQVCITLFGYSRLGQFLNQRIDPHLAFAATLMHLPYEEALRRKAADDPKMAETRQMAKAANFGFPGGMGPKAFQSYIKAYGFNLSEYEAAQLRKQWLDNLPEMREYFRYVSVLVGRSGRGSITHLVSRRRRGLVTFPGACNSFFQGMAADGAKRALFEVQRHCYSNPDSPLFGSHAVNFLHDEIMLEVPEDRAHEAATALADIMVREFNHFVPDVPVTAKPQLMRRWSKNAKPIFDYGGRLIPWDDTFVTTDLQGRTT